MLHVIIIAYTAEISHVNMYSLYYIMVCTRIILYKLETFVAWNVFSCIFAERKNQICKLLPIMLTTAFPFDYAN